MFFNTESRNDNISKGIQFLHNTSIVKGKNNSKCKGLFTRTNKGRKLQNKGKKLAPHIRPVNHPTGGNITWK